VGYDDSGNTLWQKRATFVAYLVPFFAPEGELKLHPAPWSRMPGAKATSSVGLWTEFSDWQQADRLDMESRRIAIPNTNEAS
jgi:hypothetical protein